MNEDEIEAGIRTDDILPSATPIPDPDPSTAYANRPQRRARSWIIERSPIAVFHHLSK